MFNSSKTMMANVALTGSLIGRGKKIVAIGRNYLDHAKELNNKVPKEPFFFLKPTSSYTLNGNKIEIPRGIVAHHEIELAVVIGTQGRDVAQADAESIIAGYALAIDMTARNLQDEAKKQGLPWSAAKGFDTFTPIGDYFPKARFPAPETLRLQLRVNGVVKQDGSTADMIFKIPRLIEHITSIMTLEAGDVVLTGTPAGVGPVVPGDMIEARLLNPANKELVTFLNMAVVERQGGFEYNKKDN
ncbi:hypothetical protein HGRIS_012695 [Hohenbuehelia grisea]|uniref:Fumarylacetoacetase-like C-terminal domain-containing protein n=1 Tax=Hohenbuehelia grisea TaxID=104357 RepID=A0ABR3IT66_9AGAR